MNKNPLFLPTVALTSTTNNFTYKKAGVVLFINEKELFSMYVLTRYKPVLATKTFYESVKMVLVDQHFKITFLF